MQIPFTERLKRFPVVISKKLLSFHNRHFLFLDILICALAAPYALLLRTDSAAALSHFAIGLFFYSALGFGIRSFFLYRLGCYRQFWRYASLGEITLLGRALLRANVTLFLVVWLIQALVPALRLPHSLPLIEMFLAIPLMIGVRTLVRLAQFWHATPYAQSHERTLIIGAGEMGALIARELQRQSAAPFLPVAFLDDDPAKQGMILHGVRVVGTIADLMRTLEELSINRVIFAISAAPGKLVSEIVNQCAKLRIPVRTIPSLLELLDGKFSVSRLRSVQIEDLLRREPIQTDIAIVKEMIQEKCVLVSGGGGSIGRELCRQILAFAPRQLLLLGHGENSIFEAVEELRRLQSERIAADPTTPECEIISLIADLRFADRIHHLLTAYRPDVVFHAAAHKHVPLMEENASEAITNNVLGTQNLLAAAQRAGVQRFVMISTDKAVNPTSVMGASKRVAEFLVHLAAETSGRPYMVVRFGNVLGSRGSVIHTFRQQIANGGPVTVTHPEMKRYFMTIPEAVQLVLQAFTLGQGGEVFMLDMGEPVKIVDLARDLIALSGLKEGVDIEIAYRGLRPGEKLFEEMFTPGEVYAPTAHKKVLVAANANRFIPSNLDEAIANLLLNANRNDDEAIVRVLKLLIPEYSPQRQPKAAHSSATPSVRAVTASGNVGFTSQPALGS